MKKSVSVASLIAAAVFLFASCASSQITLSEKSPMAVISVIGNSYIPWVDEEAEASGDDNDSSESMINGLINTMLGSQNPEVQTAVDRVDYAEESFRSIVSELTETQFLEKSDVVNNEVYKMLSESFYNTLAPTVKATNYKDFTIIGAKKAPFLMDSVGAKSLAIIDFTFKKERIDETKSQKFIGGVVIFKVKILDEEGREIINRVYTEKTTSKIKRYSSTDYDKNALIDLFPEAIDNAIRKFALEFIGTPVQTSRQEDELSKQAVKLALPTRTKKDTTETAEAETTQSETTSTVAASESGKSGASESVESASSDTKDEVLDARVEAAVKLVKKYNVSPEEAASDMGAPLEKVLEALKKN